MTTPIDPYQPPTTESPEQPGDTTVAYLAHRAGPGRRFLNIVIDSREEVRGRFS